MDFGEDRKFGIVLVLALAVLGGVFLWRGHEEVSYGFWLVGLLALIILFVSPTLMRYPRRALQAVGRFNNQLILGLVFYLVFTPTGLIMRLLGKDPLDKNWKKKQESYWIPREAVPFDTQRVEKQY